MRPTDALINPHVEMPVWLRTLQRAIGKNGPVPPSDSLTPLAALGELRRLDGDSLPESPDDRRSMRDDIKHALEALGAETAAEMNSAISDFCANTVGRLPDLLANAEGLGVAQASAAALERRLTAPEVVATLWRDALAAFQENADYETCALRLAQLRELVDHRGHTWDVEIDLLIRIINDSAAHVARAGGEIDPPANGRWYDFDERAGLDETVRLTLIERHLGRPASDEDAVVWLRLANASI